MIDPEQNDESTLAIREFNDRVAADERVENVSDYLSEGQDIKVVCLDVDQRGRIKLSMKEVENYSESA